MQGFFLVKFLQAQSPFQFPTLEIQLLSPVLEVAQSLGGPRLEEADDFLLS